MAERRNVSIAVRNRGAKALGALVRGKRGARKQCNNQGEDVAVTSWDV